MAASRKPVRKKPHPTTGDLEEQRTMHQGLQRTDVYIKALMENALDGIVVLNRDGTIRYQSPFMERVLGREQGEREGKSAFEFIHPDDLPMASNLFAELQQSPGATMFEEIRVLHQDGSVRTIEIVGQNLLDSPEVAGIVANLRDITERKQAEEELRESEEKLRLLFDSVSDAVVVTNKGGYIVDINKRGLEIGRVGSKEDVIGRHVYDLALKDRDRMADSIKLTLKGDRGLGEYTLRRLDGTEYPAEAASSVMKDAAGKPVGFVTVFRDITERKQAEEELHESEEKSRRLVEEMNDGYCVFQGSKVVFANTKCVEMFGYGKHEAIGKTIEELLPIEILSKLAVVRMKRQFGNEVPAQYETTLVGKDGREHQVELSTRMTHFQGASSLSVVIRDITERKQAEETLHQREEYFRSLIEDASDTIVVIDCEGIIRYRSPSYEHMLGYKPEEGVSRDLFEHIHPDDMAKVSQEFAGILQIPGATLRSEVRAQHKDGSWRHIEARGKNLLDNPAVAGIVVNMHDITERKQGEEELHIKDNAIEKSLTAIAITDIQGTITYLNEACLGLWRIAKREDVVGQSFWALLQLDADIANMIALSMIEHGQWQGELTFSRRNGEQMDVQVLTAMVYDTHGKAIQTITSFVDVTERKKMEQQLLLSGRLASVGELAAGIAHELNNPLAAVQAFAQFLADREDLDEKTKSDVDTIYKEAQRASRITSNLLSFARKHNPEKSLISINEVIGKSLELHIYRMSVNNIEIVTELDPDVPMTMADYYQMQQVFANIITNAEQAMTEAHGRGKLIIKTQENGEMIKVTFTDDGPGIPEYNLKKVFDPFFTTKEVGGGTGLGLSICYGIMQEHGGRIYAKSKVNEGTTFVVEIPVVSEACATEETDSTHHLQSVPRLT